MTLNGTKYYYEKNAQGDITGLIDISNNEVVSYMYDSWGKLRNIGGSLASTVGAKNSMRYRGYYYDTDTGLYYLQSRYYNPDWGRFISKDDAKYHQGVTSAAANLWAYCDNNPVMMSDTNGHAAWWTHLYWAASEALGLAALILGSSKIIGKARAASAAAIAWLLDAGIISGQFWSMIPLGITLLGLVMSVSTVVSCIQDIIYNLREVLKFSLW